MKEKAFQDMEDEKAYLICRCGDLNHLVVLDFYESEVLPLQVILSVSLNKLPFHKRLWYGIKYILFGTPQKYGHYEDIILGIRQLEEFKNFIDKTLKTHEEHVDKILDQKEKEV